MSGTGLWLWRHMLIEYILRREHMRRMGIEPHDEHRVRHPVPPAGQ